MSVRKWDVLREFALGLPCATEDFPWGGTRDAEDHAVAVKLTDSYEHAVALAHAVPTGHSGLGQWGWLTVRLSAADEDLLCDWVDESYLNQATKKLIAELDARDRR